MRKGFASGCRSSGLSAVSSAGSEARISPPPCRFPGIRDLHRKFAALDGVPVDVHPAVVLLDEEFHQAQTDSEALARIGVLLVEEVEHLFPDTGRDAVPVVPDREPERPSPVVVQDAEDDLDRRTGVFQGVGEQVAQDLGEGLAVGIEQDVRIGAVRADGDLFGRVAESCDGLLDQQADVDFAAAQPEPLVVHLPEIEQLADEFEQPVDVPFHDVEVGGHVAVPFSGFDDSFERGLDQRDRRLDLVGHLGEERHLGLDQLLFLLFALPPENDPDPADDQQHDQ